MSNAVLLPMVAGAILALLVAAYLQKWSLRVLFLLALRLAIGWHFLFEGLHKMHSHEIGPRETNRPFSSEPYFKVATGPLGPYMRKQFEDETVAAKLKGARELTPAAMSGMIFQHQAAMCPQPVAKRIDDLHAQFMKEIIQGIEADADAELKAADAAEAKGLAAAKTDAEKAKIRETAEKDRAAAREKRTRRDIIYIDRKEIAKQKYALWVYGVAPRDAKLKGVSNDVPMTAPQRLEHIESLRQRVGEAEERLKAGLGTGFGIEQKRAAELRLELMSAQDDLARDTDKFVEELIKEMFGSAPPPAPPEPDRTAVQKMDSITMWFLVIVGGCLLGGLCTRIACVAGFGFLLLTYLAHPAVPWYPLPPNTEGNPVFVNKNVIEALALLAIATFPTGRWLGFDALIARICPCSRGSEPTPTV